ncbi:MAG: hypothetical protein GTN97_01935 [Nitrosopumilaceae archaeon]|nr:hypothetical protein [Nitrosopumilaceae archaeon]NIP09911.1 hypothetical protein [Nitrosopumilaceae archaeon]NIS94682.1 hypothetical protein [Nitrosopumilaceae archaeon]
MIKQISIFLLPLLLFPIGSLAYGIEPLDRAVINDERLVNLSGATLGEHIIVNQQVQITAKITNAQEDNQDFVYIVQIKDENDFVVKLGWISGSLTSYQSFSPSLSWTPTESGVYTAEIFVWDSLLYQDALTRPAILEIMTS